MPPLRVGVDAWNLPDDHRGIGRYLRSILALLRSTYADRIACTLVVPEWPARFAAQRYNAEVPEPPYPVVSRRAVSARHVDLMWFPFNGPSWSPFPQPAVATLHDAFAFTDPARIDERRQFRAARDRCSSIVTVSAFSQGELAQHLGIAPSHIDVIHHGTTTLPFGEPAIDPTAFGRYVLFVGEVSHRKGFDVLVAAMRLLAARGTPLALVMAGRVLGELPPLDGIDAHVLGHVDDATLGALYRRSAVFAFPSRAEGFGLPMLEAMAAGAPVVASNVTSLPEVAGDAAVFVPPDDPAALADAIARVAGDAVISQSLLARGRVRASELSWEYATAAHVAVFERTVRDYPETRASRASRLLTR
jgi:glycosyltransferase involved in cell wall biosynthesis